MNETAYGVAYAKHTDFRCTGPECIDNCCRTLTWSINVDDKSCEKYSQVDGDFGDELRAGIIETENGWKFASKENGYCIFLTEDGWCKIHAKLGADGLCDICASFPRAYLPYNGVLQYFLNLSCPVAAEIMLFDRQPVEFIKFETHINKSELLSVIPRNEFSPELNAALRELTYSILKERSISLIQRLFYMGVVYKGLFALGNDEKAIFQKMEAYKEFLANDKDLKSLPDAFNRDESALDVYKNLFEMLKILVSGAGKETVNTGFFERIRRVFSGDAAFPVDRIDEARLKFCENYLLKKEYVFENYLVCRMSLDFFPVNCANLDLAYKSFILLFSLLQILIAITYFDKEEISDGDVLNCIYFFSRKLHAHGLVERMEKMLEDAEGIDFAYFLGSIAI